VVGQNREKMMGMKMVGMAEKMGFTGEQYRASKSSSSKSPMAAALSSFFFLPKP
jgi:hypothetical protein